MRQILRSLVLFALAAMALVLAACQPTVPALPAAPVATNTPVPVAAPADPWERIQQSGKIVVGTSADYAPFSYYSQNFVPVGFEPALMTAVGRELNVEVEIVDMAFEGLPAAIQLGQIDVAIAAISVTPDRTAILDFSDVYFVSQSAILAGDNVDVNTITGIEQLVNYSVGVQRGSIYEEQIEDLLVATGLMPSVEVHSYVLLDNAIRDLREGIIDVVMLDLPAAEIAARSDGVRLVARGLDREQYAIAMLKGSDFLRGEINRALATLRESGAVNRLIETHLAIAPGNVVPPATATPAPAQSVATATPVAQAPTATPAAPTACLDGMKWVADLNYDDNNMRNPTIFPPGQGFTKSWRILNNGTCTWTNGYALTFAQGNVNGAQMGGQALAIVGTVPPGATYDLNLPLTAPLNPGTYQGFWQMRNDQRVPFGQRIWVGIQVPGAATPTPAPTQTPSAGINFSADRVSIRAGERVVFTWNVQNVNAVFFYAQGESWQDKGVGGQDRREVYPNTTTTYELRVVKRDNNVEVRQIRIDVQAVSGIPNITRFSSDQGGQIAPGQCINLQWDAQGDINSMRLSRNSDLIWDGAPVRGNRQDCPPAPGNYAYYLDAGGPGGSTRSVVNVTVLQPTQPTATPVPPQQPTVNSFSANPAQVNPGECTILSWTTGGSSEFVRLLRNGNVVQDGGPISGSVQDCLPDPGAVTYTLEARDNRGQVATQQIGVTVNAPQPQAPVISSFTATPGQINQGDCVNLALSFSGQDLAATSITRNGEGIAFDVPMSGNLQDCPTTTGTVTYVLKVDAEFGGSTQQAANVDVQPVQAQQLPAEAPPAISYFEPDVTQINVGGCVNLRWEFSGTGLASVRLLRNDVEIGFDLPTPGTFQDCLNDASLAGLVVYLLAVDSESAGSARQEVWVTLNN